MQEIIAYTESIVDTVREPFLVLDAELQVVTASRSFYRVFAVAAEQTIGRFVYDLGDGQWNIPELRKLLEEVLPEQKAFDDFEVSHDFPSIGHRVMLLNARKLWRPGNHSMFVLLAIEDVTERKRLSDELIRSNEELQAFAYVAAHDLRSPLNSGLALLQLLARQAAKKLGEADAAKLDIAITSFQRLGTLMEDILEYSTAANAPQRAAWVDLNEPLTAAIANLKHHIESARARIDFEKLPSVKADRAHLIIVFQNLLGNAIKYHGAEAPKIFVSAVRSGASWQVSVADNGQGFNPEYGTKIFEPFKRLHTDNIPGSGIGLATSKRIIERLGGKIWPILRRASAQSSTSHFPPGIWVSGVRIGLTAYDARKVLWLQPERRCQNLAPLEELT
ncbi:MAG: PAS domain-containing protein [Bryobacterales bacterium]|nr:PAS domain-containing protein [Bryobacterales bacterium]